MATCSSVLPWEIPWTEENYRLQFIGLQRVRHDLATEETKSPLSVWFSLCYLQLIFSLAVLLGTAEA